MLEMVDLRQRQKGALAAWLKENKTLYPSRSQKQALADRTDMSYIQVSRWFANRRRKVKSISAISDPQIDFEKFDDSVISMKPESPEMTPPLQGAMEPGGFEQQKETPVSPELLQLILLQSLLAQQAFTYDAAPVAPPPALNFDPPPSVAHQALNFDPPPVASPLHLFPAPRLLYPSFGLEPVKPEPVPPPPQLPQLSDMELIAVSVLTEFASRQKRG